MATLPNDGSTPPKKSKTDWAKAQAGKLAPSKGKLLAAGVQYATNPAYRIATEAGIGMATGMAASMFDDEQDSLGSSLQKGVVAAGAGYAVTEGAVIAGTKYARSEHFAKTAVKMAADTPALAGLKGKEAGAAKVVNSVAQKVLPTMNKKMGIGAAGMAAGLMFSMANGDKDGVVDTGSNMIAGAGLALMGGELYSHFGKEKTNFSGIKSGFQKAGERIKNSDTGKLFHSTVTDLLGSDEGKKFTSELSKVFGTDEGKAVKGMFDEVKKGKGVATPLKDIDGMKGNLGKVEADLRQLMTSPEGKQLMQGMQSKMGDMGDFKNLFSQALEKDLTREFSANSKLFQSGLVQVQDVYQANPEAIDNFIGKNFGSRGNDMKDFLKTGLPKAIEELDTATANTLVNQDAKKSNDVPKQKEVKKVKKESRKLVRTNNKLTVSRMQAKEIQARYEETPARKEYKQAKATEKKMKRVWGGAKVAGVAGLGAFALASVMDTSSELGEDRRSARMVQDQEKNMLRKESKQAKQQDKQGYGNVDFGQMAIELFNERSGHHKMGNAKFQ